MLQGSCRVSCGNATDTIHAGDVFLAFPNQIHHYEGSENLDSYLLIIPVNSFLPAFHSLLTKHVPVSPILRSGQWDQGDLLPLVERAYRDKKHSSLPVMQGYLTVIIGKLLEVIVLRPRSAATEGTLQRILEYLNTHYCESISRSDVARALGFHDSYVSHLFSDSMHISLPEYVNSLRIEDACRLLRESDSTITDICAELGFQSIRSFNRVFLRRVGITPTEYRRSGK